MKLRKLIAFLLVFLSSLTGTGWHPYPVAMIQILIFNVQRKAPSE
jgi:hypothetical protein